MLFLIFQACASCEVDAMLAYLVKECKGFKSEKSGKYYRGKRATNITGANEDLKDIITPASLIPGCTDLHVAMVGHRPYFWQD